VLNYLIFPAKFCDVHDFAREPLGGGVPIALDATTDIAPTLVQVVHPLQSPHPDRVIDTEFVPVPP
jgi:hypothetical protein